MNHELYSKNIEIIKDMKVIINHGLLYGNERNALSELTIQLIKLANSITKLNLQKEDYKKNI